MSATSSAADLVPSDEGVVYNDWGMMFWQPPGWPSQWTIAPFTVDSHTFSCCEQAMMYRKALLFGDTHSAQLILAATTPREHKSLGRAVANFDHERWEQHKERIVYDINYAKFSQHALFAQKLLDTADKQLVEASPMDHIWGVGMSPKTCGRLASLEEAQKVWQGQNLLGKALMAVRDELRRGGNSNRSDELV